MSEIRKLSKFLKFLEIFGLQYFGLSKLNLISPIKFVLLGYKLYFFCYTTSIVLLMIYFRGPFLKVLKKLSISENTLGYAIEVVVTILTVGQIFITNLEAFLTVKGNQNFFKIVNKFDKFLCESFNKRMSTKKLEKKLKIRLVLIGSLAVLLVLAHLTIVKDHGFFGFGTLCLIIVHFLTMCLIWYKICFYIDLICMCLTEFNEILDQFDIYSHNQSLLLRKIYQCKRSYIYIIKMAQEFNYFMPMTLNLYILVGFLWISLRLYYLLQLNFTDVSSYLENFHVILVINVMFMIMSACGQNIENLVSFLYKLLELFPLEKKILFEFLI
ncbi:hypothetical protein ACKWTF_016413 [Chironomus riparius]